MENSELVIKLKRLRPQAKLPTKGYPSDACYDVYSVGHYAIPDGMSMECFIGWATEIPVGWQIRFRTKSSQYRQGLLVTPATIDAGYRGHLSVFIHNLTDKFISIAVGEKIAQMSIEKVYDADFQVVQELSESKRGEKGFGSSGVR